MEDGVRGLLQRVPGVACHAIRQVGRRRGLDLGPRAHRGVPVRAVNVEQVAAVAEGVLEGDGRGRRLDAERERGDPLPAVLAGPEAQHHEAAPRSLLVVEFGEVLDQEPTRTVPAHGVSSIS